MRSDAATFRARVAVCVFVVGVLLTVGGVVDRTLGFVVLGVLAVTGGALFGLARFAHRSGPAPVRTPGPVR